MSKWIFHQSKKTLPKQEESRSTCCSLIKQN